ncbi:MAG: 16S rRNA (uracil(1498)-N(3))-methyltransferase [Planctomycetota bacterium]|jgi:16S rRNA (uracil1498-N3)-methyltransferase
MNRFFISESDIQGERVVLDGDQAHQIFHVLRMKAGERITVLDNTGMEYEAVLTSVGKNEVSGRIESRRAGAGEPGVEITLYQSLLGREKFELVLQKCTEVGVSRFVPVVTQRSLVRDADAVTPKKLTRWRRIITEAAEQSHRSRIPELAEPMRFEEVLSESNTYDRYLVASPHEQQTTLQDALQGDKDRWKSVGLLIGPEGGLTEQETGAALEAGAVAVSLGRRILRTETAAIVAAALILYELDEAEV